ncbi:MAG TPA: response regulator transcription factor [Pirellulales bacterium]|jgi:two-component system OmpR family response regulator|nr:response regulator transcription factor [Pirellulales bacterium]
MADDPKHILVVEDEGHLAIGIKYNLEAEGYRASVAGDGPTALKLFDASPRSIDLVILDIMLPGMSGYAVCEALRKAGNHVPVLILSARTLSEDRIRGYDMGADQYLQKPFELDELLAMVRRLLVMRSPAGPAAGGKLAGGTFEFGRAKINFDTYEVTVAGDEVRLTPFEMNLLRYFIENEGRVISRAEMLEHVWRQPNIETTRTVDNFVMRLRKYFEVDPANPRHFLSVRGAGYRFVAEGDSPEQE